MLVEAAVFEPTYLGTTNSVTEVIPKLVDDVPEQVFLITSITPEPEPLGTVAVI